ncbi:HEPN domain-containing protein [Sulfuricurvum sp.]|uniref:HEPN domain-containing protein n=1 Tax=Sulfuricurvum sp. TaxID=2025608 RepID=UPI002E31B845|nr:HEPN domain-containing protein [Sulfuricurvum sp.]HEX5330954.1 HEPN domain-containing protein [Sulfuricurvum sp.]
MANKPHAIEWVEKSYHDLDSAKILYEAGHFTDTIGYILHQSIEKLYKSCLAYENVAIVKTHNLVELNELVEGWMGLEDAEIHLLAIATTYHTKQRYPSPHKRLPPKEEIKEILDLNIQLFTTVCQKLGIEAGTFGV